MKNAVARAEARDRIVAERKEKLEEITTRLDEATSYYDALSEENGRARRKVAADMASVREAQRRLDKARHDLVAHKKAIFNAKKAVIKAKAGIQAAQRREKMPLRILITPIRGRERVKNVQKLLSELGYEPGIADGVVGSRTRIAIRAFQRELNQKETGVITDGLVSDLYARVGREQQASAHMYVRQGFVDLFDAPVGITEPEKPIGTHVYTAMYFDKDATSTSWTALTVRAPGRLRRGQRKGRRHHMGRKVRSAPVVQVSAREALDRIIIPGPVRRQISRLLTPGSSMVISDRGMSHETGKGTDFVVLTK